MGYRGLPAHEVKDGVHVIRVPALRKRQATCETHEMVSYVVSALPRVIRLLRKREYDVIHCHFVIPTGLLAYAATRFRRTPVILTSHGSDIPAFNPDRFTFEHRMTPPLLRLILRHAACITAPSEYLRSLIREHLGDFDIVLIPNGIDVARFEPQPKRRRILMSGRLLRRKGFHRVLEALRAIETDFEVHILGDGPMRPDMEALAQQLRVPVVFHGWVEQDSPLLKELYETSAVFCLPSERENASIALLEAMLAGMAVITSDVTGCPETVGDAGIVVAPDDLDGLRDSLQTLLRDEALRADYGVRARRRVLERFDIGKTGAAYLKQFQTLTARGGG
jgi:glycosyltransferase involved in cell wall biosynthesis